MSNRRRQTIVIAALSALALTIIGSATVVMAARWNGQFSAGGHGSVVPSDGEGPAVDTAVSFGMNGRADQMEVGKKGDLESADEATVLGHGTWVDYSSNPPRTIRLLQPTGYRCDPDGLEDNILSGLGTDSGRPDLDEVEVRVASTNEGTVRVRAHEVGEKDPYYKATATITGGHATRHSCQLSE